VLGAIAELISLIEQRAGGQGSIGVGIPVGADLEYADEVTMLKAMEGRRDL